MIQETNSVSGHRDSQTIEIPLSNLTNNYSDLLNSGDFSDLVFKIANEPVDTLTRTRKSSVSKRNSNDFTTIKAHRCILSSRSPVFKAMLAQNDDSWQEGQSKIIKITDIDSSTFSDMLVYIYTDKIAQLDEESAMKLLACGDKYGLLRLKSICEQKLFNLITNENVCDILVRADIYQAEFLRQKCIEFLNQYGAVIVDTDGYERLTQHHPHLVNELYKDLIKKNTVESSPPKRQKIFHSSGSSSFRNVGPDAS